MMSFNDLPVEVLPLIIQHILRPSHLAQLCLVNKDFRAYTVPQLYERPSIYAWHREAKNRATQLFRTLANCPNLARYVRRLELRDFPKAISRDSAYQLTQLCVSGLGNCVNLASCTWTRDGSLKDDILEALSKCPSLKEIEINGRHAHNYDPSLLHKFEKLRRISVIMPSAEVVHALPRCFEKKLESLQELTIICKFTSVVNDAWIQALAPSLSQLKKLHLAGCPKITHKGMIHLLQANVSGLADLALEGVSPSFDMKEFAATTSHTLSNLVSITLTFPVAGVTHAWLTDVEALLLESINLKQFHLYASGDWRKKSVSLDAGFVRRFVETHKESLTRFALLRLPVSLDSLSHAVKTANKLEQLFVSVWRKDLNNIGSIVAQSRSLRSLHITYAYNIVTDRENIIASNADNSTNPALINGQIQPYENSDDITNDEESGLNSLFSIRSAEANNSRFMTSGQRGTQNPLPSMAELEELASHFGERLTQFGVQSRVWQVESVITGGDKMEGNSKGAKRRVRLAPYESPDVPDVFLVVRT